MDDIINGRERPCTAEKFNLRQMKMETGQQVTEHLRNQLQIAEDLETKRYMFENLFYCSHANRQWRNNHLLLVSEDGASALGLSADLLSLGVSRGT